MMKDAWLPESDTDLPRTLMLRLRASVPQTDVRATGWADDIWQVGVWPLTSAIEDAVIASAAPLNVQVYAVPVLPQRYGA